jgi:hypothetical protein
MPTLTADGGALEKVMTALVGRIARRASVFVAGLAAVESFSCWKKAVAEFEGEVSLGVAAAERGRKVIPIYGVNSGFGPFEPNAVFEESVVSKGAADGAGACHEELYLGGWEKRKAADEIWKGAQFGGCEFVGVAVELG